MIKLNLQNCIDKLHCFIVQCIETRGNDVYGARGHTIHVYIELG